jgi:uncharacterized protein
MSAKILRDPIYNYVSIDRETDDWLIRLLDCPEMQRLRRIHQLGISNLTYPGAEHSRLSHSLGVLHLMQVALTHLSHDFRDVQVSNARLALLAAALLHDVGHGPFSHVFEPCLDMHHEEWSRRIILEEGSPCHEVLASVDRFLPQRVAALIDPNDRQDPSWMKYLLSSQLDVDRLDYLQRDSFFSGAGYGHYDWFRILNSFQLQGAEHEDRTIVWKQKSIWALEEYVFARYYMYQNVYLHKTTRGFERMLEALWRRGRAMFRAGDPPGILPPIQEFWAAPDVRSYLRIEEFTVLHQIQNWAEGTDKILSDLSRRFLYRKPFSLISLPDCFEEFYDDIDRAEKLQQWHDALCRLIDDAGLASESYCLRDEVKPKYHQPYFPEQEEDEQSPKTAIRVLENDQSQPTEISLLCPRLRPVAVRVAPTVRHYVPVELRRAANELRVKWKPD